MTHPNFACWQHTRRRVGGPIQYSDIVDVQRRIVCGSRCNRQTIMVPVHVVDDVTGGDAAREAGRDVFGIVAHKVGEEHAKLVITLAHCKVEPANVSTDRHLRGLDPRRHRDAVRVELQRRDVEHLVGRAREKRCSRVQFGSSRRRNGHAHHSGVAYGCTRSVIRQIAVEWIIPQQSGAVDVVGHDVSKQESQRGELVVERNDRRIFCKHSRGFIYILTAGILCCRFVWLSHREGWWAKGCSLG